MTKHTHWYKKDLVCLAIFILPYSILFSQQGDFSLSTEKDGHRFAAGVILSTLGIGIEGHYILSNKFVVRAGVSYLKYGYPLENVRDDLVGKINVAPSGVSFNVDYWLVEYAFLSAGFVLNSTTVKIDGKLSDAVMIGDIEILPDEVGQINAELSPGNYFSPYLGIGLGQSHLNGKLITFIFESGILFHGKPTVKLNASGMLTPTANNAQELLIEENISPLSFYPIVSFSLYYHFMLNR